MRLILLIFCGFAVPLFAQDTLFTTKIELTKEEQNRMEFAGVFKSSWHIEAGGKMGFVGLGYDLLLSRHLRLGVGVGYPAVGMDVECFPFGVKRERLLFKFGGRSTAFFPANETSFMIYSIPIGFSYFTANRINVELDAGPLFKTAIGGKTPINGLAESINYVWFSVKLGYRFSFYNLKKTH